MEVLDRMLVKLVAAGHKVADCTFLRKRHKQCAEDVSLSLAAYATWAAWQLLIMSGQTAAQCCLCSPACLHHSPYALMVVIIPLHAYRMHIR